MNGKILWILAFVSLISSSHAFDIDSSFVAAFGLGHSSGQQPPDPVYGETNTTTYGSLNLNASASWNTSWYLNYAGFAHAREVQISWAKIMEAGGDVFPNDYKNSLYLGHQFRFNPSLYIPITIGASASKGIYRGDFIGDNGNPSNNPAGPSESYYTTRNYYAVGGFVEADPSITIGNSVTLGLRFLLDVNTHRTDFSWGIQLGFLIP